MTHDPFLLEDILAVIGALCLLVSLGVVAALAWSCRSQERDEQRRNAGRADWSAGRRAL